MSKKFYFEPFSISTQFSSIWPIDRTLSDAITPGQSVPGSDGNEGVLCIPQIYNITETSLSDYLVSYPGQSLGRGLTSLQRCSRCILLPQPTGRALECVFFNGLLLRPSEMRPFDIPTSCE